MLNDPTANLVRAFDIQRGDIIEAVPAGWKRHLFVEDITPVGGDEMGPAVFQFSSPGGLSVTYPYAALVTLLYRIPRHGL